MSPLEALAAARAADVEVRLDGKDLIVSAASEPPDDICAMLSRHKPAIVELLQAAPADAAAALARRAQFKEQAAAVLGLRRPTAAGGGRGLAACYGEKAAISEFDHGMPRRQAEKHAVEHCISEWLYQHPMASDADDGCPVCGDTDRPNDPLLAIGLGGGQVWAHRECAPAWRAGRIAEAVTALAAMGITGPEGRST